MPLSLKTVEMQIKDDQWNKKFRTVQVYREKDTNSQSMFPKKHTQIQIYFSIFLY